MTIDTIYQAAQKGTGSEFGSTFHTMAALCGRKANLSKAYKEVKMIAPDDAENATIGTLTHALLDAHFKGAIPASTNIDVSAYQTVEWTEARRLFKFMRAEFLPDLALGLTVVASELKLPLDQAARDAYFGHSQVTGAADILGTINQAQAAWWAREFDLHLQPGLWLLDWKTTNQRHTQEAAEAKWLNTLQAKLYPALLNCESGGSVLGTIYLAIVRHKELRRRDVSPKALASIQAFASRWYPQDGQEAKEMVEYSLWMQEQNRRALGAACYSYGRPCPFKVNGFCKK